MELTRITPGDPVNIGFPGSSRLTFAIDEMKKKTVTVTVIVITVVLTIFIFTPLYPFRPVVLRRTGDYKNASPGVDFWPVLARVLEYYGEPHINTGKTVLISSFLFFDTDLRLNYTQKARDSKWISDHLSKDAQIDE